MHSIQGSKKTFLKPNPAGFGVLLSYVFFGFFHGQMGHTKYRQSWQDVMNCTFDKVWLYALLFNFITELY